MITLHLLKYMKYMLFILTHMISPGNSLAITICSADDTEFIKPICFRPIDIAGLKMISIFYRRNSV